MLQLCLWAKIRTKQWLVLGALAFQCMRVGFLCPKCDNFACLHTHPDLNELHLKRWFFFAKIGIFCKSIAGPLSEAKTHWMVNWLQLLNQLNFVWRNTKVFIQNSSQWCLRNVQLLRITVNWCWWWRFTHTFCHNILWCKHCFWLFTLWFIDEDASFFHFFHKITNILSTLTVLVFFQNPYAIFANILQPYHDFQSNVAIFSSVVEAYTRTQPYWFGGRIKLIICQIRHELSVTIHEIGNSWKKNVRWRTQY